MKKNFGFTLIELLLVIAIIAILAGISLRVLNPGAAQDKAGDGVRLANMSKLSDSIIVYHSAEGSYPAMGDEADSSSLLRTVYIDNWPRDDPAGATYSYFTDGTSFGLVTRNSLGTYYKYHSNWGQIQTCANGGLNDICSGSATPVPSPTAAPTSTPTPTSTPSPTSTPVPTSTPTPTLTSTPSPTSTPTPTPTYTPTPTPGFTPPSDCRHYPWICDPKYCCPINGRCVSSPSDCYL